jgi:hypothetical protein
VNHSHTLTQSDAENFFPLFFLLLHLAGRQHYLLFKEILGLIVPASNLFPNEHENRNTDGKSLVETMLI